MFYFRFFIVSIILACTLQQANAQVFCPNNINFENGNLGYWKFDTAINNGAAGIGPITVVSPLANRDVLTTGAAVDYYGGFPIVDPLGGSFSLKLGNDSIYAQVDQAKYTFTVPSNVNNYSLIYRYAVVFENPNHAAAEQPYFKVRVYDSSTGNPINCASFTYVSQSSLPGFSTSTHVGRFGNSVVYYKPWSTASLNLSGQAGKTLVLEFTTADCSRRGHMGYGYVDVSCGFFAISASTCSSTSQLSGPPGFLTYQWYNSNYTTLVDTGRVISLATPTTLTSYNLVLIPYPGYGCQDTLHTTLIGSALSVNAGPDTMLCNNQSINLQSVVTGNFPPFSYSWAPASSLSCTTCASPTASPTTATNYILTVTDSLGCIKKDTLNVKARVSLLTATTNVICAGGATGTATASASNGTPGYTYSWNTVPPTLSSNAIGLAAGTYIVTATDSKSCIDTASVTIAQPSPVIASILSTDSVSCNSGNNGKAVGVVTGGRTPYTYSWNTTPVQTSLTATGLVSGTYILTATDSSGCTDTALARINQPSPIVLSGIVSNALCFGAATGGVVVNASGGTAPYTYAIGSGSFGSNGNFTGLTAGTYQLHVKDAHGCLKDSAFTIGQAPKLSLTYTSISPLCFGGSNGSINLNAGGGTPTYQYAVGTGSFGSNSVFNGLNASVYVVHIKDANSCTLDSTITITQPTPVKASPVKTNVSCNAGSDGTITFNPSGGTPGYTFAIGSGSFVNSPLFAGLAAGTYLLHIHDTAGCSFDTSVVISQPPVLNIGYTSTQPLCNAATNGSITISGSGGTPGYQYATNTGLFLANPAFTALGAGTYVLHLKDALGCTRDSTIQLNQPTALAVALSKTNVSCFGGTNGTATSVISGGTAPYSYTWSSLSQTTAAVIGLGAGSYTLTATDAHGCVISSLVSITQPSHILSSLSGTAPSCQGGSNGTASATINGGTPAYTYHWLTSPAQTTATATGLLSGTYGLIVTDSLGCKDTSSVTLAQTPPVVVALVQNPVSCYGGNDGQATAIPSGSTAPYTYSWNSIPVQTSATAINLKAGTYTVTATSALGCVGTGSINVLQASPLTSTISIKNTCPGFKQGSLTVIPSGGNAPYTYSWNTMPIQHTVSATALDTGTYQVIILDLKGCSDTSSGKVGLFTAPNVSVNSADSICLGSAAALLASGAQNYLWTPVTGLSCDTCAATSASPAVNTLYTVIGTDANGCKDTARVPIDVIQHVPVKVDASKDICAGDTVQLGAAGGLSWTWYRSGSLDNYQSTHPKAWPATTTIYKVVIRENKCFVDTLEQLVNVDPLPTIDLGPDIEAPIGAKVVLNPKVTNASTITWLPANGLSCANCFSPDLIVRGKASYVAIVYNDLGCPATDTINILEVCDEHFFWFANTFTPNGDGNNDWFYPQGIGSYPVQHFMIYDRWGEIVFSAENIVVNDPQAGWNGTFKGQTLKPDVYVYVMDALCSKGNKVVIRGDVTLIR